MADAPDETLPIPRDETHDSIDAGTGALTPQAHEARRTIIEEMQAAGHAVMSWAEVLVHPDRPAHVNPSVPGGAAADAEPAAADPSAEETAPATKLF